MKKQNAGDGAPGFPVVAEEKRPVPGGSGPLPPAAAAIPQANVDAVNALHKKFMFTMKKGAALAFEIGRLLREIWGQQDAYTSWPD